jgi:hypothetical protein
MFAFPSKEFFLVSFPERWFCRDGETSGSGIIDVFQLIPRRNSSRAELIEVEEFLL